MTKIFILGESSFLGKHLYIEIKKQNKYNVILLNHNNFHEAHKASSEDIVINFCGINRSSLEIDYEEANHIFLQKVINILSNRPYFIHISSLMVYGFKNKETNDLSNYQKWFIKSKSNAESYLQDNYPHDLTCIIRPSNIYGYDCVPYYNNLLSSLVYEKIKGYNKINTLNANCVRNMLSVQNFTNKLYEFINNKKYGVFNVMSQHNNSLEEIIKYIYKTIPEYIILNNEEIDVINTNNTNIKGINIIIKDDIQQQIKLLEEQMIVFLNIKDSVEVKKLNVLVQPRGNMVEITGLKSKRLYKITLNQHSISGNHYHLEQTEEFYTNKGKVLYLFAYDKDPNIIYQFISYENDLVTIKPTIIHTLVNDFVDNQPEIIISSTQEFIENIIPDTKYINII